MNGAPRVAAVSFCILYFILGCFGFFCLLAIFAAAMKPIMPSKILKDSSASFARNNSYISNNRHDTLCDLSQGESRSRSPSVKRKANDNSYANAAKKTIVSRNYGAGKTGIVISPPPPQPVISPENLEIIEVNSAKIASICEKLHDTILAIPEENPICPILRDFCSIFHIQSENSKIMLDAIRKSVCPAPRGQSQDTPGATAASGVSDSEMESDSEPLSQMVSLGRIPKARNSLLPSEERGRQPRSWLPAGGTQATRRADTSPSPSVDPCTQRFRDLVKDAEKSTVIFNLDMGRVPVINRNTMCVKATTALTAMAASVESRPADNPSRDTIDAIDDALSVADNASFFGSSTKSVTGKSADSGAFCTIPVCYKFPDKETRVKAEQVLRTRCKASCATPYPQSLRECMKKIIENGRMVRPDDFCSVSFDLARMGFRVSWRTRGASDWIRHDTLIPLPDAVIQSPTKVPEGGFVLEKLNLATLPATGPPPVPPLSLRPGSIRPATNFYDTVDGSAPGANPPLGGAV